RVEALVGIGTAAQRERPLGRRRAPISERAAVRPRKRSRGYLYLRIRRQREAAEVHLRGRRRSPPGRDVAVEGRAQETVQRHRERNGAPGFAFLAFVPAPPPGFAVDPASRE